jgi:hypothetical protein
MLLVVGIWMVSERAQDIINMGCVGDAANRMRLHSARGGEAMTRPTEVISDVRRSRGELCTEEWGAPNNAVRMDNRGAYLSAYLAVRF